MGCVKKLLIIVGLLACGSCAAVYLLFVIGQQGGL
jgi:hypothetical protein